MPTSIVSVTVLLTLFVGWIQLSKSTIETHSLKQDRRDPKIFGFLSSVRLTSQACNTTTGDSGICFSLAECVSRDGRNSGSCAAGFGVCCSFVVSCGGKSSENNTYFVNDDIQQSSECSAQICRNSETVCQLRLDFDTFDIAQPHKSILSASDSGSSHKQTRATQCLEAGFTVSSDGSSPPVICGSNTGYHMIVEANEQCNILSFFGSKFSPMNWKIKVSQISCTDPNKAPEGCLQYFTGISGTIQSYNFIGGSHLALQMYDNCVRTEQGYCSISWSSPRGSFEIDMANKPLNESLGDSCNRDFIIIRGGFHKMANVTNDRYCGNQLVSPELNSDETVTIRSFVRPFRLGFVTDVGEQAGADELTRGFSLDFKQEIC